MNTSSSSYEYRKMSARRGDTLRTFLYHWNANCLLGNLSGRYVQYRQANMNSDIPLQTAAIF